MPLTRDNNDVPFDAAFQTPSSLYRGAPFWSWNGSLDKEELLRQIDIFKEMGIGGYHIHSRTGLNTAYLSDAFMDLVRACRDKGRENGMLTWLYDEDRWPSGFAGGLVTKEHAYRRRHLLFTRDPYSEAKHASYVNSAANGTRQGDGVLLARFGICLVNKHLSRYRLLKDDEAATDDEQTWYAYLEVAQDSSWFNDQAYVDTLNPKAMQRFIEVTHERYKAAVGDSFGTDVPAIFTDEPQFTHKGSIGLVDEQHEIIFPWTPDLDEAFAQEYGDSILAHMPEVIWDLPDHQPSVWRYRYHEWVAERFAQSFADQIGGWCLKNGLALTGHMMEEPTLESQTNALGDAMRSYRSMQIPGIDMLCDRMELTTAKQAQSAARQFGCPGTLSELYGVTGWHFDFKGHKRQGDWQAALGVLFRVHHLSWYCMRGEAKRDYPASISYQSSWYKEYPVIEDHFARVGATMSRGRAVCRVGVVHPIESYWLAAGPKETSGLAREVQEEHFANLADWLLLDCIDFDYISESLLPDQKDSGTDGCFGVGDMEYDVVIVPPMHTIRSSTLDRLARFADAGGRVLFLGETPEQVDAEPSTRANVLAERCERIPFERARIMQAVENFRDIAFVVNKTHRLQGLLYQLREEEDRRYLFVCMTERDVGPQQGKLYMNGEFQVTHLDTSDGSQYPVAACYEDGKTVVDAVLAEAGHLLLKLVPGRREVGESLLPPAWKEQGRMGGPVPVTLDEPNVLLFEKAAYAINGGDWKDETQLLDVENVLRAELGMHPKSGNVAQPWVDQSPVQTLATIALRVAFDAEVPVSNAQLALENIDESSVMLDGQSIDMTATGYFTDHAISTVALPAFSAGRHVIEISLSFTKETSIEWFYLLGDFGVRISGTHGVVTPPVTSLELGDWTTQGLPFYGGNVTYHFTATADGDAVRVPSFNATTLRVSSGGLSAPVYRDPYIGLVPVTEGAPVDITVYGHRANCFGPIHLCKPIGWLGPNSYRVKGLGFSPEYCLKPLGIPCSPIIAKS